MLAFLLARLTEPSTYAGFGLIASGVHSAAAGQLDTAIGQITGGIVAAFLPEGTAPAPSVLSTQKS